MKLLRTLFLLAGLAFAALAVVNYFSFYPILCLADDAEVYGAPFLHQSDSDVLLIVDTATIRQSGQSGSFSRTDWSYGWINMLIQFRGHYSVMDVSELNTNLSGYRTIILTHSVFGSRDMTTVQSALAQLSQAGAGSSLTVYCEQPNTEFLQATGVDSTMRIESEPKSFRHVTDYFPTEWLNETMFDFPLHAEGFDISFPESAVDEVNVLLEFDESPILVETNKNGIRYLVSSVDFGRQTVSIQQGRPDDDFSVTPKIHKKTSMLPLVSGDLIIDSAYYERFDPYFDEYEQALWFLIRGGPDSAVVIPEIAGGAFVMSHDEEGMGDHSAWMPEYEAELGVHSTVLITPASITKRGMERLRDAGADVQAHVDKYSMFRRPGLPGLRPYRVEIPVAEQVDSLEALWGGEIEVNRNHWLLWNERYTQTLRRLAAAGIKMDLSYGPLGDGLVGNIFGTSFPFVPLDTNGFPLPILELPFSFQDDERFEPEYIDSLFAKRGPVEIHNVIFHSNSMGYHPDTLIMWGWEECFNRAKANNLPILSYKRVLELFQNENIVTPLTETQSSID